MKKIDELMATEVHGWTDVMMSNRKWFDSISDKSVIDYSEYSPTTDMNQALECVDELPWDEYVFELSRDLLGHYRATIYNLKTGDKFIGVDDSAPLAICKALLKAKGIDYE